MRLRMWRVVWVLLFLHLHLSCGEVRRDVREGAISTIPVLTHPLKLRELPQSADCGAIWQLSGGPHFILRWHTPLCSKVISRLLGSYLVSFVLLSACVLK